MRGWVKPAQRMYGSQWNLDPCPSAGRCSAPSPALWRGPNPGDWSPVPPSYVRALGDYKYGPTMSLGLSSLWLLIARDLYVEFLCGAVFWQNSATVRLSAPSWSMLMASCGAHHVACTSKIPLCRKEPRPKETFSPSDRRRIEPVDGPIQKRGCQFSFNRRPNGTRTVRASGKGRWPLSP